jgi:hypothetical protein
VASYDLSESDQRETKNENRRSLEGPGLVIGVLLRHSFEMAFPMRVRWALRAARRRRGQKVGVLVAARVRRGPGTGVVDSEDIG